jgi:hypothetical protein
VHYLAPRPKEKLISQNAFRFLGCMIGTSTIRRCTEMIALEKGKEIPKKQKEGKYPYHLMEVGDSFYIEGEILSKVCNASYREWKRTGRKFTARKIDNGVRVWRVE